MGELAGHWQELYCAWVNSMLCAGLDFTGSSPVDRYYNNIDIISAFCCPRLSGLISIDARASTVLCTCHQVLKDGSASPGAVGGE